MGTHSKSRTIVILTDDKKGHVNQSWAVARLLPTDSNEPQITAISIQYKSKIHQLILSLLTYIPLPKFSIPFFLILTNLLSKLVIKKGLYMKKSYSFAN